MQKNITYQEALKKFMSPALQEYCDGPAYRFLCVQLKNYLESEFSKENLQALELARESFIDSVKYRNASKNALE